MTASAHVLDTNIVLDLWVFEDPRTDWLREALRTQRLQWLATPAMRAELARVLGYPHIARRLLGVSQNADTVLARFDQHASVQAAAPKAPYTCTDRDDQMFIDLAVQHQAFLHSKDKAVLCMKNRLARLGVSLNPPSF